MPPMVRSDAAGCVDFGASLSSTEKPPDAARRGADAFATRAVAFDPKMRMTLKALVTGTRKRPGIPPKVARYG